VLFYRCIHFLLFCSFFPLCDAAETGFLAPDTSTAVSDDGTVQLVWASSGDRVSYEVRRSSGPGFEGSTLVYEGRDTATFVSGLPEGEHYFKVRSKVEGGAYRDWPDKAFVLTVEYIDGRLVAVLMSAGFVTFVAIVGTIIWGHRNTERLA